MFTKIFSLVLSVLLFLLLFGTRSYPYFFAAATILLIVATFAFNYKRLNFTWPHLLLPTTYLAATGSVFALIPDPNLRIVFLLIVSVIFYYLEIKLGRESHLLQNLFLLSVFGIYLGLFAFQFYLHVQIYFLLPLIFAVSYIFAVQGFAGFGLPSKKYFHFLTALVVTEAAWGLTFWPTHFFVDALVLFCLFYILWLFAFSAFFGKLSRAKIYWQLTLVALVLIVTLSTAAWRPLR